MIPASFLAEGRVDVWFLEAGADPGEMRLTAEEEARAGRMASPELAARTRRRRRFLRQVLSAYLGRRPDDVRLGRDAAGKPLLPEAGGLHFNLSHSGDVSVLAVGTRPLGIDVEGRRPFPGLRDLVAHSCSPRERASIFAAPDPTRAFLDRWVVKEAVLKCRGTGLVDDLGGVDPGPMGDGPVVWAGLSIRRLVGPSRLLSDADLHIALAVDGPAPEIVWARCETSH